MKEIKLNSKVSTFVDDEDYDYLMNYKWRLHKNGYAFVHFKKGFGPSMHSLILSPEKGKQVDHKDGNKLNNQKVNLRLVTYSQNQMNRVVLNKNNTSGIKGVKWHVPTYKWLATITVNKKTIYLGSFEDKKDAKAARENAERKLFKEFSSLTAEQSGLEGQ